MTCWTCRKFLNPDGPRVLLTFAGFSSAALNRTAVPVHPGCVRMEATPQVDQVKVEWEPQGWTATCRDHGEVALKEVREDAELVAGMHLRREHVGAAL